jgi:leucyl aminopeptidase
MSHTFRIASGYQEAKTVVLPVTKSNREAILAETEVAFGHSKDLLTADFSAEKGETFAFYPQQSGVQKVVLLGLGDQPHLKSIGETFTAFAAQQKTKLAGPLAIDTRHVSEIHNEYLLIKLVCAVEGGMFALGRFKKEKPKDPVWNETILLVDEAQATSAKKHLKRATAISAGQLITRELVYEPANHLTPDILTKRVEKLGKKFGFEVTVFDKKELEKRGMNGILAVGAGSAVPPRLLKLEYKGNGKQEKAAAALVGKGVTFDTGGISIKDSNNMHFMKSDMAGAAAVIGLFCTLAATKVKRSVVGLLPIVENMADGGAYRPSDVITSYSGLGIEVLDTDAEGRIILADALSYAAKDVQPEYIVDLATLTGSVVTALGYQAAGLFTQHTDIATRIELAASHTGERVWRLPMWDEYAAQIASDIADVKNLGGPAGGSITAAKFLEKFTLGHNQWAHIDIAGVALATVGWAKDRVATGYGVELLAEFVRGLE